MRGLTKRPTLFSILATILILIGLPYGFYGLTLSGGASLGGAIVLIAVFFIFGVFMVDRALVERINNKKLSLIEFLVLCFGVTIYLYSHRELEVVINNDKNDFLIVIENNGDLKEDSYISIFPFKRKITTRKNLIVIPKTADVRINPPKSWTKGYYYNIYSYEKYPKVYYYGKTEVSSSTVEKRIYELMKNN